jgi:hypothetical protein
MSFDNEYTPSLSAQHIELIGRIYLGMDHARSVVHLSKAFDARLIAYGRRW